MTARIFKPAKNAMQSGTAKCNQWLLEFIPEKARPIDPLTGWNGSAETTSQLRLSFTSLEEALAYAKAENIPYELQLPKGRTVKKKAYADNFSNSRIFAFEGKINNFQ